MPDGCGVFLRFIATRTPHSWERRRCARTSLTWRRIEASAPRPRIRPSALSCSSSGRCLAASWRTWTTRPAPSALDEISYPSVVDDAGERISFNRDWLLENLQPVIEFEEQHNVPVYVGEFGLFRWVPGAAAFIDDEVGLFEEYGWNYAFYVWRGDVVDFDAFNMEYGPDRNNTSAVAENSLLSASTVEWSQYTDFP